MHRYQNILYVMDPNKEETGGFKQALSIARNNDAALHLLLLYSELPAELRSQQAMFEDFLAQRLMRVLEEANAAIQYDRSRITTEVLMSDASLAIAITRYAIRHEHDMVIKESESMQEHEKGFKAVDMTLLRKCPTALYLARPIAHSRDTIRVAVAVDPLAEDEMEHDINLRLLQLAREVADTCSGSLDIVSCWDYAYESYLRHNAWVKISNEDISDALLNAQAEHRSALNSLIKVSGIEGKQHIHHLHGDASELISEFAEREAIDIMIMGTVGRTGIAGYLIGNTAETIFEKLDCSLFTLKPRGFVSPIKAYD